MVDSRLGALGLAALLVSCSGLSVKRISTDTFTGNAPKPANGLIASVSEPHSVLAFFREGSAVAVERTRVSLPSLREVYLIGYRGAFLGSRELSVELHADGTLKRARMASESQVDDALGAVAAAGKELSTSLEAYRKATTPKPAANPTAEENEAIQIELRNLMLKANRDAAAERKPLPYPNVGL